MSETDLAYLAGVIDGEGHVCVRPGSVQLVLCMADVAILEWCQQTFGGTLSGNWKNERMARPRRYWALTQKRGLEAVARGLLPYLVLKRREVQVMLEALEHRRVRPHSMDPGLAAWAKAHVAICDRARDAMRARKQTPVH